ncbi:hypothetical protein [Fenollaria massiliensis]|uniref:hypothetical protein n=1 Tax=Fenollaria massiliensis TaxID=938288 RepID=UPI000376A262|nr:hypothetical protein [Fenollaria massiliensis]
MSKLISSIFIFQEMYREKIINNSTMLKKFRKVYGISLLIFFAYVLFLMKRIESVSLNNLIIIVLCIINIVSGFVSCIKAMCTSISYFLKIALFSTFIFGIFIYFILCYLLEVSNISYFLLIVIFTTIWTFLSTFSENKIGTLSNAILAVLVGISLQANSFIWSEKELALLKINVGSMTREENLALYKVNELAINKVLFPIFVMTAIGALSCAYKEYWLEKNEDKLNKLKDACKKVGKY